jgi:hypothetical protein
MIMRILIDKICTFKLLLHGTEDVDRSSFRNAGSMGITSGRHVGRPPRSRKPKVVSKPSFAWDHFTRDETSSQEDPMAHCNYCGIGYNLKVSP